jgi:dCTP diphosphatase
MKDIEKSIKEYLAERGWDDLRPADLAKSISIEAGELLELFQWSNQSLDEVRADADKMSAIKKELADVLIYCFDMSVLLELDTKEIIERTLAEAKAKYPAHLFKGRDANIDAGTEDIYWQIKKQHRMKGE